MYIKNNFKGNSSKFCWLFIYCIIILIKMKENFLFFYSFWQIRPPLPFHSSLFHLHLVGKLHSFPSTLVDWSSLTPKCSSSSKSEYLSPLNFNWHVTRSKISICKSRCGNKSKAFSRFKQRELILTNESTVDAIKPRLFWVTSMLTTPTQHHKMATRRCTHTRTQTQSHET